MIEKEAFDVIEKVKQIAEELGYESFISDGVNEIVKFLNIYETSEKKCVFSIFVQKQYDDNIILKFNYSDLVEMVYDYDYNYVGTHGNIILWSEIQEVDYDFLKVIIVKHFKNVNAALIMNEKYNEKIDEIHKRFENAIKKFNNS